MSRCTCYDVLIVKDLNRWFKVQTISESLRKNTEDIWKHVRWTKTSSDKKEEE